MKAQNECRIYREFRHSPHKKATCATCKFLNGFDIFQNDAFGLNNNVQKITYGTFNGGLKMLIKKNVLSKHLELDPKLLAQRHDYFNSGLK